MTESVWWKVKGKEIKKTQKEWSRERQRRGRCWGLGQKISLRGLLSQQKSCFAAYMFKFFISSRNNVKKQLRVLSCRLSTLDVCQLCFFSCPSCCWHNRYISSFISSCLHRPYLCFCHAFMHIHKPGYKFKLCFHVVKMQMTTHNLNVETDGGLKLLNCWRVALITQPL